MSEAPRSSAPTPAPVPVDRPAAIRRALRDLVAERGFHHASMADVAKRAGVATGTAYVHYASKDDLVYATYLEIKEGLGAYLLSRMDPSASPHHRFATAMRAVYDHFREEPARAKFLAQLEESPYFETAFAMLEERGNDPLLAEAARPEVAALLVPYPPHLYYAYSFGIVARIAASGASIPDQEFAQIIESSWRAITR